MATPKKTEQGTWRIQIEVCGVRDSITTPTKREAERWAAERTLELRTNAATGLQGAKKTLGDAFRRYADEVSPQRRGERWERIRLNAIAKKLPTALPIGQIGPDVLARWRDDRLLEVAPSSVARDMALLASVFEIARREWRWIAVNPIRDVRKPRRPPHRKRVITFAELRALLRAMGYPHQKNDARWRLANCLLLALSTGMRSGELTSLTWSQVYDRHINLPKTKTDEPRDVALTAVCKKIIERMWGHDSESVFNFTAGYRDTMFRKARAKAGLEGFTFHDARHTAATRIGLSRRLSLLEFCKHFGWLDPKYALVYFNPGVTDIADALDGKKINEARGA